MRSKFFFSCQQEPTYPPPLFTETVRALLKGSIEPRSLGIRQRQPAAMRAICVPVFRLSPARYQRYGRLMNRWELWQICIRVWGLMLKVRASIYVCVCVFIQFMISEADKWLVRCIMTCTCWYSRCGGIDYEQFPVIVSRLHGGIQLLIS